MRHYPRRRNFVTTVTAVAFAVAVVGIFGCSDREGSSQSYPNRPVKLVVPFNTGGASDTFARMMQKAIVDHELLPEPIVIVNRGGAGGTIGSRYVKHRRADGYTIMLLHQAVLTAHYAGKVEYGPEAFDAIAGTGEDSEVIVVGKDSPYSSIKQLVAQAERSPNTVKFAVNLGAPTHFTAQAVEAAGGGVVFRYVQSGGGADRFAALAGGHVDVTIFSVGEFKQFNSAGLKALAVFDAKRNAAIPDVPTARESGVDVVSANMQYWWAPRGTPPERIRVLAEAIEKAMATDQVQESLNRNQTNPIFLDAGEVEDRLARAEEELSMTVTATPEYLGFLPHTILTVCLVLGLVALIQSRFLRSADEPPAESGSRRPTGGRAAVIFAVLTIVYAFSFGAEAIDSRFATMIFIVSAGLMMTGLRAKPMITVAAISLITAFGTHFVLARWLSVDLP